MNWLRKISFEIDQLEYLIEFDSSSLSLYIEIKHKNDNVSWKFTKCDTVDKLSTLDIFKIFESYAKNGDMKNVPWKIIFPSNFQKNIEGEYDNISIEIKIKYVIIQTIYEKNILISLSHCGQKIFSPINNNLIVASDDKSKIPTKILEVKTYQTSAFKQVIEKISNVGSNCCIVFVPPSDNEGIKNSGGMYIQKLNDAKDVLIKLNLNANHFERFECAEPKITIGVDTGNLHTLLQNINNNDPIVLYMNEDNRNILHIRNSSNNDKSTTEEIDIEVDLLDIPNPEIPIPKTEFENKITIASDKFNKICENLNRSLSLVEITLVDNEISFRGQDAKGKITRSHKDINCSIEKKSQLVQGTYKLHNLVCFSKCDKLCNTIDIYLKQDFPLVLDISVTTLGKLYVFVSPVE